MNKRDILKKQLIYRSCHRGCKETDFLLGDFAIAHLDSYSMDQLLTYKAIVEVDDIDLYRWLSGESPIPADFDTEIMQSIIAYQSMSQVKVV